VRILLATSNPGKIREIEAILSGSGFEIDIEPIWLGDIETGVTYLENARIKAASAVRLSGRAVLAEDSGIEVDVLGGLPGIHAARFAGPGANDAANNAKLLRLLEGTTDRQARYRAVAVLSLPSSDECIGEGSWEGSIATAPAGDGGFGYDPIFVPKAQSRTAAQLSRDDKNAVSHRAHALRQLVEHARAAGII